MLFSINISVETLILLGIIVLLATLIICWYWHRFNAIAKAALAVNVENEDFQPVSIIVYANNDCENLSQVLPLFLCQDYPEYEVIVIDDSSLDGTKDLLLQMSLEYKNLYHTFVPDGTLNLSQKKLSLTLGMKAAKYDIIVGTSSNCYPPNNQWLRTMMTNFMPDIDVVIGYAFCNSSDDRGAGKYYRSLDTVFNAVQYISYSLCGKTYRGDGNNLAYRKSLFFDNKGFSASLNLHYGDDDMFINSITNATNTRVALSKDSQLLVRYDNVASSHKELKLRYDFTSKYINTWAKRSSAIISALNYLLFFSPLAVAFLSGMNFIAIIAAVLMLIATWTIQIICYRKAADTLSQRKMLLSVPFLILIRPILNLRYKMIGRQYKKYNYTWQRKKV